METLWKRRGFLSRRLDREHAVEALFNAENAHALELVACGATWAQAAEAVGASKGSVGDWVRAAR